MIEIRLVSRAGEAIAPPLKASFGESGGDIGRAADCTLVLPDAERHISRKHLQVAYRDGRHVLRMLSANLPVELDGVPIAPGIDYPLEPGAEIRIGSFVLQAAGDSAPPAEATTMPHPASVHDALTPLGAPPPGGRPSVFHDLLHAASPAATDGSAAASRGMVHDIDVVVGEPTGAGALAAAPLPASVDMLIESLYEGLGIAGPKTAALSPSQMRLIGALLRTSIEGTLGLLAARSIAKRELGANLTLPQSRENNPLKFSPDADAALGHLLGPQQRGFIAPLAAMRDAFEDLRLHEVAVLAGMRAALEAVLARFDPELLEARLAAKGLWDNVLPVNRKARLWERYTEQHADIMREVEDDFDSIFGHAFIKAYEANLARLAHAGAGEPPARGEHR